MSLLDPIAAMLVSTDGRFDRTALDALIEQARFIPMARLSGVHQEHIMRQLEQLRSQPKLAGLIDEASGMVHHHVRPLMFFNGREVVERTDLARMVVAALFEIPRQRYIGSCWLSADKFSIHAAAPELFLQQLGQMLQHGRILYEDNEYAVPPNVPVEKAQLLKKKVAIDVCQSRLTASIIRS